MKNLIYLINSFDTGGAEKAMTRICSNLDETKYNIKIIALHKGNSSLIHDLKQNNLKYNYYKINKGNSPITTLKDLAKLYKQIKKNNNAILICSLFHSTILGRILGKLVGIKKIINWEHNQNLGSSFRKKLNNITMFLSYKIIADSKAVYNTVKKKYNLSKNKLDYIPIGGINLNNYKKSQSKKKKIFISSVGRLHQQKGYDLLIPIAKEIIKTHPNVIFKIAGDGEEKQNLQKLIKQNNLQKKFILEGFVRDIPKFLSKSDIYIQPSRWEGLCMTVVEAIASYQPIVAFNVGGIKESMKNNINGYLIKPYNKKQFQTNLEKLIKSKKLRNDFGRQSRRIAKNKYDIKKMINKFEKIIK